jgi:hypothetical protein
MPIGRMAAALLFERAPASPHMCCCVAPTKVHDVFEDNDNFTIVMDMCHGGELFKKILQVGESFWVGWRMSCGRGCGCGYGFSIATQHSRDVAQAPRQRQPRAH